MPNEMIPAVQEWRPVINVRPRYRRLRYVWRIYKSARHFGISPVESFRAGWHMLWYNSPLRRSWMRDLAIFILVMLTLGDFQRRMTWEGSACVLLATGIVLSYLLPLLRWKRNG